MNEEQWRQVKEHNGATISCIKCGTLTQLKYRARPEAFKEKHTKAVNHDGQFVATRTHGRMLAIETYPATAEMLKELTLVGPEEFNLPKSR